MKATIEIYGPNHCVLKPDALIDLVREKLKYHETIFRPVVGKGQKKEPKKFPTFLISKKPGSRGVFLTGFLWMVKAFLEQKGVKVTILDPNGWVSYGASLIGSMVLPPNLVHRIHQSEALNIVGPKRGYIVNPTGSGKTVLGFSWLSQFKGNVVFLTHMKDLLYQVEQEARDWGFDSVGTIGDGKNNPRRFTVGMVQTIAKMDQNNPWFDSVEAIIMDECHHVSSFKGHHAHSLIKFRNAWNRLGLTATEPPEKEARMAIQGFLGPKLHTIKMDILVQRKILAKPRIVIKKIPKNTQLRHSGLSYKDMYEEWVIKSRIRNRYIILAVKELVDQGLTCLVVVTKSEHGEVLIRMFRNLFPQIRSEYVWGNDDMKYRNKVKHALNENLLDVVIATTVWKEGVDIPTLGAVVNAAGGKSEIAVLQNIGRGTRAPKGKTEVIILDFFDSSITYLVDHFGERLTLYFSEGWM